MNLTNGIVILRALNTIDYFRYYFKLHLERAANASFTYVLLNRWLSIRLDAIFIFFAITVSIL